MSPSSPAPSLIDEVAELARMLRDAAPAPDLRDRADVIIQRLSGPLRVAVAGRVKAGKSTLINALVGERIAPTDAGECTRIVSVYRHADGYDVNARAIDGRLIGLPFRRSKGALDIGLAGLREQEVEHIDVGWPSTALRSITLIDTPGLASINDETSRRTRDFLEADPDRPSDADAVIHLIRHAHRSDIAFLDAFMDRSVIAASPVNAVAVLSRADEIGGGRLDAIDSARRIANRYERDPQLGTLCSAVIPFAGLIAETGQTLREDEASRLRLLATTSPETLTRMLLSVDHFCDLEASELTVESRRDLLDRFGLFGVRLAIDEVARGLEPTATALGAMLVNRSGLTDLRAMLASQFAPRARILQSRSAVAGLRAIARSARDRAPELAAMVDSQLERIEANTLQFVQVRAYHLVSSGAVALTTDDRAEFDRLVAGGSVSDMLGIDADATDAQIRSAALGSIGRWRSLAGDPLAHPLAIEVFEVAARTVEGIYARV